jgi:hypothetical protein
LMCADGECNWCTHLVNAIGARRCAMRTGEETERLLAW